MLRGPRNAERAWVARVAGTVLIVATLSAVVAQLRFASDRATIRIDPTAGSVTVTKHYFLAADAVNVNSTMGGAAVLYEFVHGDATDSTGVYLLDDAGDRIAKISTEGARVSFNVELTEAAAVALGLPIYCEVRTVVTRREIRPCEPGRVG